MSLSRAGLTDRHLLLGVVEDVLKADDLLELGTRHGAGDVRLVEDEQDGRHLESRMRQDIQKLDAGG